MLVDIGKNLINLHIFTFVIGAAAFGIIHGIKKFRPHFPAGLLALVVTTSAVWLFQLQEKGVAIIGEIPSGLPHLILPPLDYETSVSLSRSAINFASGAKSGISSVVSSLVVVLALLFLTPLLRYIPKAALAALVISAVLLLFHPKEEIGAQKSQLALMGVHLPVMHVFKTSGFYEKLDPELVIETRGDALKILFKRLDHSYCKNTCPYELFHECPTVK